MGTAWVAEVGWSEVEPPVVCRSIAEVDAALERLDRVAAASRGWPVLADIEWRGYAICLGLGIDPTVVEIHYPPCDGEFYTSAGEEQSDQLVDFSGRCGHCQYRRSRFVPMAKARQAIREFLAAEHRSEAVRWKDWAGRPA